MRKNPRIALALIVLVAIAAAFFVVPKGWGTKVRAWKLGLDLVGGSHLVYEVDLSKVAPTERDSVLEGLREVIERRVNLFGVSEPQVYIAESGEKSNLVVELAGIRDISDAIQQIGETPFLDFREVIQNGTSTPQFIPTNLTGRFITGAQLAFDPTTRAPQIALSFTDEGGKIFEELTERNVGKLIAVFLDDQLVEMATVTEKISGGQAVITGQFSLDESKQMVERFNAGALPAPITLVNQQTISATLGIDSLQKAAIAGLIGTLLVIVFMIMYYGVFGIFASLALIIYIILTLAVFKLVPVTMTLAGLAGFIITIGMAVDANILIFERVKEELKRGLTKTSAIQEGFRRAWPSIRDSNISSIITAVILYFFTSSFVRGFALTLFLGVLTSMFSAITTTRLFLTVFASLTRNK